MKLPKLVIRWFLRQRDLLAGEVWLAALDVYVAVAQRHHQEYHHVDRHQTRE